MRTCIHEYLGQKKNCMDEVVLSKNSNVFFRIIFQIALSVTTLIL